MTTFEEGYPRLGKAAEYYGGEGWHVIPVHGIGVDGRCTCNQQHTDPKDIGKHPAISAWQNDATDNQTTISNWWNKDYRYNPAAMARNSGFLVIDVDPRNGGFEALDRFEINVPDALTPTVEAMTGEYVMSDGSKVRGRHLYYRVDENENLIGKFESIAKDLRGVDVKHRGYTLLPPANHLSGVQYEWKPGHAPWEIEMAQANDILLEQLRKKGHARSTINRASAGGRTQIDNTWSWVDDLSWGEDKLDVNRFLDEGIDEGSRAIDIYALACALSNKFGTDEVGARAVMSTMEKFNAEMVRPPMEWDGQNSLHMHVERAIEFVRANPKTTLMGSMGLPANDYRRTWAENRAAEATKLSPAPVVYGAIPNTRDMDDDEVPWVETTLAGTPGGEVHSIAYSGGSVTRRALNVPKDPDSLTAEEGGDPDRRSLSDLGNGRRFVDTFQPVVRYTPGLGWFNWVDGYWKPDIENLGTREYAKRLPSLISREVVQYEETEAQGKIIKWADATKANAKQNAAIESATSDPRIFIDVEQWDANPILFGCRNGVINLQTGELLRGQPDLHITRRGPVAYTPGLRNKRWEEFLDFATGGDKEYQDWLQRAAGYTLTGLRTHDVMFMVYGPPGTGKNVFVEALIKVMGTKEYAWPMDSQILASGDGASHGTDEYHWAQLRGRRVVWFDELPENERIKENSVKRLTGSSEIPARSPGEKPFTFTSQAKMWVTTNHRPIITDDAMWRRIRPIPWMNVPEKIDPSLKEYIFDPEGGLPAVLAWAVDGAQKILNSTEIDSLGWCKAVQDAADIYRKNEDRMGKFIEEETVEAPGQSLSLDILFATYEGWANRRSEKPMSRIAFDRKLSDRQVKLGGEGRRAVIMDRILAPAIPTDENSEWGTMAAQFYR